MDEKFLLNLIEEHKTNISEWAKSYGAWGQSGFTTYDAHFDDRPENDPCVLVMWMDGSLSDIYHNGFGGDFLHEEFHNILDNETFYPVHYGGNICFYCHSDDLAEEYRKYYRFRWIHKLLTPGYAEISSEVFEYFKSDPSKIYEIDPRKFEVLLDAVFKNMGFRTELGPGQGDAGVDLRLYQHDKISEVATLVQAKRFSANRAIRIEAVQALESAVSTERANRGIFVTTSRFLPSTREFAKLHSKRIILADSSDIRKWVNDVSCSLQQFNIELTDEQLFQAIETTHPEGHFLGMVVCATWGYNMVNNSFGLIVKATKNAVWIWPLQTQKSGDSFQGHEIPVIPKKDEIPAQLPYDQLVFARRTEPDQFSGLSFWGSQKLFFPWDGKPKWYDYLD